MALGAHPKGSTMFDGKKGAFKVLEVNEGESISGDIGLVLGKSTIYNKSTTPPLHRRRQTATQRNTGIDITKASSTHVDGIKSRIKYKLAQHEAKPHKVRIYPGETKKHNNKILQKERPLNEAVHLSKRELQSGIDIGDSQTEGKKMNLFSKHEKASQSHKPSHSSIGPNTNTYNKQKKMKKEEPEIMDLVSDDSIDGSESDNEMEPLRSNNELPTVIRGALVSRGLPASNHFPETKDTSSLVSFIQVQKVYLGKKCYSSDSLPLSVKISKRGLEMVISAESASVRKDVDASQVLVPSSEISCVFVEKDCNSHEISEGPLRIVFDPNSSISNNDSLIREIPIGHGKTLSFSKNTKQNPAQYLILVFDGVDAKARYISVHLQLQKYMQNVKNKDLSTNQLFMENTTNAQQNKWITEANEELARHVRSTRRSKRRRQSNSLAIGEQEGDGNTFIMYPMNEGAKDKITITNGDMRRLTPPEYLNDSLIDFKIKHMLHEKFHEKMAKVHCFPSYFYKRLTSCSSIEHGFQNVATWTKNVDIFNCEMLIVPINQHAHWSVLFILKPHLIFRNQKDPNLPNKMSADSCSNTINAGSGGREDDNGSDDTDRDNGDGTHIDCDETACIVCLDSLAMHNTKSLMKNMKKYLLEEYISKKCDGDACKTSEKYKFSKNTIESMNSVAMKDIPTQDNNYDCGMYLIKYVETMLYRWPLPSQAAVNNKFRDVFDGDHFSPTHITEERNSFYKLLTCLKPIYDMEQAARQHKEAEDKRSKKQKQKADVCCD